MVGDPLLVVPNAVALQREYEGVTNLAFVAATILVEQRMPGHTLDAQEQEGVAAQWGEAFPYQRAHGQAL